MYERTSGLLRFFSDVDRGNILSLLSSNLEKNLPGGNVECRELDFFWDAFPDSISSELRDSDVILAADVVYDKNITRHFFKTVQNILNFGGKTIFIAIERRLWTDNHGNLVAPNFDIFKEHLEELSNLQINESKVLVEELKTDFPKYFEYNRVPELTLWKIVMTKL